MSRARNIKPGFFRNDVLAECEPLARILFVALWCAADREGRLEDRPKRLKGEYLPYDNCDADALLQQLHDRGFIERYSVDGIKYIQVLAFKKHQNPHVKEAASTIPAPGEHRASTVQAGLIPDSLIPDSPSLNPESEQAAQIPLRDGTEFRIPDDLLAELKRAHPRVDVLHELRQARVWSIAKPEKRKTRRGVAAFLATWMSKAEPRAGPPHNGNSRRPTVEDFSSKDYQGTPENEQPEFLRAG